MSNFVSMMMMVLDSDRLGSDRSTKFKVAPLNDTEAIIKMINLAREVGAVQLLCNHHLLEILQLEDREKCQEAISVCRGRFEEFLKVVALPNEQFAVEVRIASQYHFSVTVRRTELS